MTNAEPSRGLTDLALGETAIIQSIALPDGDARRLMELGFLPGASVEYVRRSPFGDPRVYLVDGTEIALRRETALQIRVDSSSLPG